MKHLDRAFFAFFGAALFFSASGSGQQLWSNVISPSRAINWQNAGLPATFPDGETTPNPWTPPTRTQCGSTINPSGVASTDLSNINSALASCTAGHYVLLGSGTFLIQGQVNPNNLDNITLRGSGAQSTILNVSGSGIIVIGEGWSGGACSLTSSSSYSQDSATVTCNNLSGSAPTVGTLAQLNQCDTGLSGTISGGTLTCSGTSADNGGLFVCGSANCNTEGSTLTKASQFQSVLVTSVSDSGGTYTVGISSGLYMSNWAFAQSPILTWNSQTHDGIGDGLEDLTVYNGGASGNMLQMQNAYASWVKGVRILGATFPLWNTLQCLVANDYFFGAVPLNSSFTPGMTSTEATSSLFLNNIFNASVEPWEGLGGNVGNVFASNYARDGDTGGLIAGTYDHASYDSFDLFEGNEMPIFLEDDTWGTHGLNTYFRNFSFCYESPYLDGSAPTGMSVGNYQRFMNYVGNAIGTSGQCTGYQGNGADVFRISGSDSLTTASLLRWGNVSVITQSSDTPANSGIRFASNELPLNLTGTISSLSSLPTPSTSLPCSFFLPGSSTTCTVKPNGGTGLSWWKVCNAWTTFPTACAGTQAQPFPPVGPDESGGPYVNGYAYDVPAAVAWKYLPVDSAYQQSYTISGSSWSSGTETLTFSSGVLPNVMHLMGAFQLTGVNSACTTGAAFGGNSEILITGSSSTTVQYALAANPGVICTGKFMFPDVRQFDERVYQSDGNASGGLGIPVNLKATDTPVGGGS